MSDLSSLATILKWREAHVLDAWIGHQLKALTARPDLVSDEQLRSQSREFLAVFAEAVEHGGETRVSEAAWAPVRDVLGRVTAQRAQQGFSPSETAVFIMSLKQPLFEEIRASAGTTDELAQAVWATSRVVDDLALHTIEVFQKSREDVIARQQAEMLELSTPVVTLWKGILALPLIGTLDSERTQVVMESLLERLVATESTIAILDITGVPTVDTLVAQHLLRTVAAARLMGADCIISGIRPQIAQTIVHLGLDLSTVATKATLADAFALALSRLDLTVRPKQEKQEKGSDLNRQVAAEG
jgi:rsbT co-antagonist protein RsbR